MPICINHNQYGQVRKPSGFANDNSVILNNTIHDTTIQDYATSLTQLQNVSHTNFVLTNEAQNTMDHNQNTNTNEAVQTGNEIIPQDNAYTNPNGEYYYDNNINPENHQNQTNNYENFQNQGNDPQNYQPNQGYYPYTQDYGYAPDYNYYPQQNDNYVYNNTDQQYPQQDPNLVYNNSDPNQIYNSSNQYPNNINNVADNTNQQNNVDYKDNM